MAQGAPCTPYPYARPCTSPYPYPQPCMLSCSPIYLHTAMYPLLCPYILTHSRALPPVPLYPYTQPCTPSCAPIPLCTAVNPPFCSPIHGCAPFPVPYIPMYSCIHPYPHAWPCTPHPISLHMTHLHPNTFMHPPPVHPHITVHDHTPSRAPRHLPAHPGIPPHTRAPPELPVQPRQSTRQQMHMDWEGN